MHDALSFYPRVLIFTGVIAAFLFAVAMVPGGEADATAIYNPTQSTAADTRKLGPSDCRPDQHAYAPSCSIQGRTVRVISF